MIKTIKLKDAVGTKLAHDITEIRPEEFKGAAFHKGHRVCKEDLCRLQKLGKNHLYLIELEADKIHENEAAAIAGQNGGVVSVRPLRYGKAGLIITGNEVYHGLIEDRFAPILTRKLTGLGCEVDRISFAPDDTEIIRQAICEHIELGCDLILLSDGMSVDPDDVTRTGIRLAGADEIHYGAAALPGAMFLLAYIGKVPLIGVPACGLHHRTTVLDLVLPRVLAGEKIGKKELAF